MKVNFKILIILTALHSSASLAAAKKLTCSGDNHLDGERFEQAWVAVFDTDDFKKEAPTYEYTLVRYKINGVTKKAFSDLIGATYRYPMSVSPTTLTFNSCSNVKNLGTSCIFPELGMNLMTTIHVSRKDLSLSGLRGNNYSCILEDFGQDNLI